MTVTRDDIEAKAREIFGVIDETRESARDTAVVAGVVVAIVVAAAFIMGRRRGKGSSRKTVVEVYKV